MIYINSEKQIMTDSENKPLSRRNWLGLITTASLSTTLLAASSKAFGRESRIFGGGTSKKTLPDPDKSLGAGIYNIKDFGAVGDGKTLDTNALQSAIDTCNRDKGGTVLVPAGVFVIGTVEMKSNVILHLSAQATLLGTADGSQYFADSAIPLRGDSTLGDGNVGLIFAVKAENFSIEGMGTIDGNGAQFRSPSKDVPPPAGISGSHRPYHLLFYQCKNIAVRDIYLKDSAFHSVRVVQCTYAKFEGLHIHSRVIHNNDGFHFISSKYVHVSKCDIQTQDDACALFGSCQFVTVSDCSFSTRWSVFRFGGGIAENITVTNCIIYETYGCPIKMHCSPGSRFENVIFSNLIMKDVTGPISINLGPQRSRNAGTTKRPPGIVRNISFSNIRATVVKPVPLPDAEFPSAYRPGELLSCIVLNSFDDEYLENISFSDVHVTYPGGGTAEQGALRDVPKVAGEYFEIGTPPAYALYARNVRGLTLQNVRFEKVLADLRPSIIFDHVEDASVVGLGIQGQNESESVVRFMNCGDILLNAVRVLSESSVFLKVEGSGSRNIKIDGGDLSKSKIQVTFHSGAVKQSVRLKE
jgi:hypothetical protein